MKKIMFNDKYGLTKAVLEGRKTMTRRVIPVDETKGGLVPFSFWGGKWCGSHGRPLKRQPYNVGDVVAVAESYEDIFTTNDIPLDEWIARVENSHDGQDYCLIEGTDNKMFVKAELMPHKIRITGVRIERLQNISDKDCMREGIYEDCPGVQYSYPTKNVYCGQYPFGSPRSAFAALFDKLYGKGTWDSNPYVFVYEFELVK